MQAQNRLSEEKIHGIIGNLLRGGVLFAAGITLIGGVLYLLRYGNSLPDYHVFRGEPADLRSVSRYTAGLSFLSEAGASFNSDCLCS